MARNILSSFAGRGIYLDDAVTDVDLTALQDLLDQLVGESDEDTRRELAGDVLTMIEGKSKPEGELKIGKPVSGLAADRLRKAKAESLAASFGDTPSADSFVQFCRQTARQQQ